MGGWPRNGPTLRPFQPSGQRQGQPTRLLSKSWFPVSHPKVSCYFSPPEQEIKLGLLLTHSPGRRAASGSFELRLHLEL